ncbi:MAG: glycosyltransferase [Anaerolineales bacterium]
MKLLVVQETDWLQRGPHQQHHLFERLTTRGHEVVAVDFEITYTPWPRAPLVARQQEWGSVSRVLPGASVRVVRPGTLRVPGGARVLSLLTFHRVLSELVAEFRPAVLVDYALSTGMPALRVARRRHIPFLLHVIDSLHTLVPNRWTRPVASAVERRLLRAADSTLYINHALRDYGVRMGAPPALAHVIGSGVDLGRFDPGRAGAPIREKFGFQREDVVLVFVGWLYKFAGIDTVMRTLPELPPNVKMLVVGVGEAEVRLRRLAANLALRDRVVFTGRQPYESMPDFMAAADVCLLFSELNDVMRHIVPIKLFEYMAAGRPVLASELPGVMREVPPDNGVLYAAPEGLRPALEALLDPRARARAGQRARAFAEAHCDWEQLTDEFEQLLQTMATP